MGATSFVNVTCARAAVTITANVTIELKTNLMLFRSIFLDGCALSRLRFASGLHSQPLISSQRLSLRHAPRQGRPPCRNFLRDKRIQIAVPKLSSWEFPRSRVWPRSSHLRL